MIVAVTGASGFIGSHVIAALVDAGHEPVALARSQQRLAHAMELHQLSMPRFVLGDVTDHATVARLLEGVDAVIHTAGTVSTKTTDAEMMTTTNVEGTRVVIDAAIAARLDPIVHLSSVAAVFPNADSTALVMTSEDPTTTNQSPYARSKAAAELIARQAQTEGHPVVTFYPGGVFGPNDPGTSDIIDGTLLMMDKGAFVLPKGSGNAFIDIRDLRVAIANAIEPARGPRRYMAGGTWVEWDQWIDHFTRHTNTKIRIIPMSASALHKLGSALDWVADRIRPFETPLTAEMVEFMSWAKPTDDSKLHAELGVVYRPVDESVRDFVAWLKADGRL